MKLSKDVSARSSPTRVRPVLNFVDWVGVMLIYAPKTSLNDHSSTDILVAPIPEEDK
ncbi:hypothetical protein [Agarivorans aestuarii]|uniref:hypothetical protein n=1 Tax=Agarivorans aestuarii TaxID=1563703 RepID=UPI001C80713E|nr:hypothetical protein [Agarivorans aestuarii]